MRITAQYFRFILLASLLVFSLNPAWSETAGIDAKPSYRFGVVPQFAQRELFRIWSPILAELERRTGFRFVLTGSPQIPVFEKNFLAGDYDFAYMNPYHVIKAHQSQGYDPLVRDGDQSLTGILVVPVASPVKSLPDLEGKKIAFPAPNALGASLLIRAELARIHQITVHPVYVKTHSSVYLHVAKELADAGGGVRSTLQSQPPAVRERLRVIYETRPMAPHPVSAHPRVPAEHRERVRQAFLDLGSTPDGAALLAGIPVGRIVSASMEEYRPMLEWGLDEFWVD